MDKEAIVFEWVSKEPNLFPNGIKYWIPGLTFERPIGKKQAILKLKIFMNKMAVKFGQHCYFFWGGDEQKMRSEKYAWNALWYHFHGALGFEAEGIDLKTLEEFIEKEWDGAVEAPRAFRSMTPSYKANALSYVTLKHPDFDLMVGHIKKTRACRLKRCGQPE